MPFDAIGTTVLPLTSYERWDVDRTGKAAEPRIGWSPVNDSLALYLVWIGLRSGWAKRLNDAGKHCVVGWVATTCEPMTIIPKGYSPQSQRLLKRLHDALPRSAQRPTHHPKWVLAKYNDTHGHDAIVRVAERAYHSSLADQAKERQ